MAKILLIEDEINIASFIERGLSEAGYTVDLCTDGHYGWERLKANDADLIILDLIIPGIGGLELCKRYRDLLGYKVPVLMLTALGSMDDIVNGLNAGADDYLVKPFRFPELAARVNALLRRHSHESPTTLSFSDLTLDLNTKTAHRGKQEFPLTVKEFRLLEYFLQNPNIVLSRMQLLEHVWDIKFDTNTNVVDVYVNFLRNKIDKNFSNKLIHTVIGMGYILKPEEYNHETQA